MLTQRPPSSAPSGRMTMTQNPMPNVPRYRDVSDSAVAEYCRTHGMFVDGPACYYPRR